MVEFSCSATAVRVTRVFISLQVVCRFRALSDQIRVYSTSKVSTPLLTSPSYNLHIKKTMHQYSEPTPHPSDRYPSL